MTNWNKIVLENISESSLNGLNLPKARKAIEKVVYANIGGLYRDDYWNGPKKIWDALTKANIDFTVMGNRYRKDRMDPMGPDKSKEWDVEFHFVGKGFKQETDDIDSYIKKYPKKDPAERGQKAYFLPFFDFLAFFVTFLVTFFLATFFFAMCTFKFLHRTSY